MVVLDNVLPVCIKVLSSCKKTGKKDVCCCSSVPGCLQSVYGFQSTCVFIFQHNYTTFTRLLPEDIQYE